MAGALPSPARAGNSASAIAPAIQHTPIGRDGEGKAGGQFRKSMLVHSGIELILINPLRSIAGLQRAEHYFLRNSLIELFYIMEICRWYANELNKSASYES